MKIINVKGLKKFILSAYSKKIFRGRYIERQKFLTWLDDVETIDNFDELKKILDILLFERYELLNFQNADKCFLFVSENDKDKIDMLEIIINEFFTVKRLQVIESPKTAISFASLIKSNDGKWLIKK